MDEDNSQLPQTDHDLLIELRVELKGMRQDVNKANDDTRERLLLLGANKVEKDSFATYLQADAAFKADHETRVRRLELWGALAIGALWIVQLIIGWYLIVHFNNH